MGYTNMVDLGDLVNNSAALFTDTGSDVLSALEDCVVYKVNGPYREKSSGLSCYYSYSGNTDDFIQYASVGASDAFRYLYSYELSGSLDEDGIAYVSEMGYGELPEIPSLAEEDVYKRQSFPRASRYRAPRYPALPWFRRSAPSPQSERQKGFSLSLRCPDSRRPPSSA